MRRVALYARYSSDNQNEGSIEDQLRICREQAQRDKWEIVGSYHDVAISGASVILWPGIQSLVQDAQRGKDDGPCQTGWEATFPVGMDPAQGPGLQLV
jgi:DNA invertase Pin-like site-specific DNA recombinase